jgi:hypothetical protein
MKTFAKRQYSAFSGHKLMSQKKSMYTSILPIEKKKDQKVYECVEVKIFTLTRVTTPV